MMISLRTLGAIFLLSFGVLACSAQNPQRHADLQELQSPQVQAKVVWQTRIGQGTTEHYTQLQPAYDRGVVYAAERTGLVIAHDAERGKRLWVQDLGSKKRWFEHFPRGESPILSAGPLVHGDRLYVGSESGRLFALDKETGETIWVQQLAGEIVSLPTVAEGYIVLHLNNGRIIALKEQTGEQVWMFEDDTGLLSLRSVSRPTVSNGGVIVGTATGKVMVLILESGHLAWEERIVSPQGSSDLERMTDVDGQPLVLDNMIYISGYNGQTMALDLRTGEALWKRDYGSYRAPISIRNQLAVVTQESHLVMMDRIGGTELWRNDDLYFRSLTDPILDQSYLIAGDRFGYLHWFDRRTGELVGRLQLHDEDAIRVTPVRMKDGFVVQTAAGRLYYVKVQTSE